jgi:phage-related protein
LGNIGSLIGKSWNDFIGWVNDSFGRISSFVGDAWDKFVKWINDNIGAISRWVGEGWEKFVNFLSEIGKVIGDTLKPVWDKIVEFFSWVGEKIGQLSRGDIAGFLGIRGQFGLTVPRAGKYFLEAGELVLSRADVMRLVSALGNVGGGNTVNVSITIAGPIYGVDDLEERVRDVVEREVGNILYDIQRRGVR